MTDDYADAEGPGKFEGNAYPRAAAQVYDWSLEGCNAEEIGSVDELGWFGLLYFDDKDQARLVALGWTPDADASPESQPVAAIVGEDQQGFVTVAFYDSEDSAQADWAAIQGDYDHYYDEQEGTEDND